jgi:choline-glycine betaine transporter
MDDSKRRNEDCLNDEESRKKKKAEKEARRCRRQSRLEAKSVGSVVSMETGVDDEERRRRKLMRNFEKHKARLEELGLDEYGQPLDAYSILKYPVREWTFTLPGSRETVALNPVVTLMGLVYVWGLVVWSTLDPQGSTAAVVAGSERIALTFSWLFQAIKATFFFFMMFITYRYGHIRLGQKKDVIEYSNLAYFCMIFTAGAGPSLLSWCLADTLSHQHSNFYVQAGYRSQDEIDMFAINMSVSNWGITSWILYTAVAVCMSLACHRFRLPMIFRSCYYPILGSYTWGWMGDVIDGFTVMSTLIIVCSVLGWTAITMVTCYVYMGWVNPNNTEDENAGIQNTTIWLLTIISTASIISGLRLGIRYMSIVAVAISTLLMFLVFKMDDSKFLLNLQVQEVGYYAQTSIFQLNLWTDTFGQLREGAGRAIDGKASEDWWAAYWIVRFQAWV